MAISLPTVGRVLGFGALVAGGVSLIISLIVMAVFIGPLIFWFAWNVLDFGEAVGLSELGFWAILLATFFLTVGSFGKVVLTAIVFLTDPDWFHSEAMVRWPEATLKNFVAIALLAGMASFPHARKRASAGRSKKSETHGC